MIYPNERSDEELCNDKTLNHIFAGTNHFEYNAKIKNKQKLKGPWRSF